MNPHAKHDLDELSEALDDRLSEPRRRAVKELLRACPECRAAYEAMAWTRAQVRRSPAGAFPPALEPEVRRALDREARRSARRLAAGRAVGLALAAALLLGLALLLTRATPSLPPLPEAVAADFKARAAGLLPLALETTEAARVEAYFAAGSLGFPTRVFDLGMMGYTLRGGRLHRVAGRPSALSVYHETATDREVICEMLREGRAALPPPDSSRRHDGIPFRIYRREGVTVVFWPEGDVLCVLAGDGDPEALVQLAFAKAMKARPREP